MPIKRCAAVAVAGLMLGAQSAPPVPPSPAPTTSINDRMAGDISPVHDPALIRAGDTWYLFNTVSSENEPPGLIHIRTSKDLVTWTKVGAVFAKLPEWAKTTVRGTKGLWAPDVAFVNGQYRVYYSVSTFGSNHSAIGLATSPTLDQRSPDYKWTDQGLVYASTRASDHNAIDPNFIADREGNHWLSFGSFWTGLKMIRLDPATGKPSTTDKTLYPIARRASPGAVEAPFIIDRGGYYYLFASFDSCCRGAASTYYTVVGRSKAVTGPYVDYDGKRMMQGYGQVVLHASLDKTRRFRGPGHPGIARIGDREIMAWHAYDARNKGVPTLRIAPIGWTKDGWPVIAQ
ncbi:MAG TPA: arabinan endo-1,5-alpha-L-arabinosidase [Sphingomonas sp.]|nr:arabinan endo-1,5-alpha-L-arabinosidase [Sphingomonas sp.]HEU0045898.1 arabinan endo-1,5-alpha-L-arabinosidase [Sphingomonas sp.]